MSDLWYFFAKPEKVFSKINFDMGCMSIILWNTEEYKRGLVVVLIVGAINLNDFTFSLTITCGYSFLIISHIKVLPTPAFPLNNTFELAKLQSNKLCKELLWIKQSSRLVGLNLETSTIILIKYNQLHLLFLN